MEKREKRAMRWEKRLVYFALIVDIREKYCNTELLFTKREAGERERGRTEKPRALSSVVVRRVVIAE